MMGPTPAESAPPRTTTARLKNAFQAASFFFWGMGIAALFGAELVQRRWSESPWRGPMFGAALLFLLLEIWRPKRKTLEGVPQWIGLCVCLLVLYLLRSHAWVATVMGAVFGLYYSMGKARYGPLTIAAAGCFVAGGAVLLVPWPAGDRELLILTCAGLSAALQGIWIIVLHLSGRRSFTESASADAKGEIETKRVHRTLLSVFGENRFEEVLAPGLEQDLRSRHEAAIREFESLGFRRLCCWTESFPAWRCLLVLPAMFTLRMARGGDRVRLRGGRIHVHYLMLISRDGSAFAHVSSLGASFDTAFADGTILGTRNWANDDIYTLPLIKHYRQGGITAAWADHQGAVAGLEDEGRRAVRQGGFAVYRELSIREQSILTT